MGALAGAALLQACADDSASLRVVCNVVPTVGPNGCLWEPEAEACLGYGLLNLDARLSYVMGIAVESGLTQRQSDVPLRAEQNGAHIEEIEVEIQRSDGRVINFPRLSDAQRRLPNPYTLTVTGYAYPGERGMVLTPVIPAAYGERLALRVGTADELDEIVLSIIVRGTLDGTEEVESSRWRYPLQLASINLTQGAGQCYVPNADICWSLLGQDDASAVCSCAVDDTCAE